MKKKFIDRDQERMSGIKKRQRKHFQLESIIEDQRDEKEDGKES